MVAIYALLVLIAASPLAALEPIHIALTPVEREGYVPAGVAAAVRAALEEELAAAGRFELVERARLEDVLKEVTFQQSGVTDQSAAAAIGQQLNVDLLVFASVARLGTDYGLQLRVVDVASGRVVRADKRVLGRLDTTVRAAARRAARDLAASALALRPVEMVALPGGTFTMGSADGLSDEAPPHPVTVAAFEIDRTEVSRAAYGAYLESQGRADGPPQGGDRPVTMVSWSAAQQYCQSLGKRLPTEAEWEYAARGSSGRTYPWGNEAPTAARARFAGRETAPVDLPLDGATPEGILHLAGNVAEWVADWWDPAYYRVSPELNPPGPANGDYRVVRGGGWNEPADALRSTARSYHNHLKGAGHIGFRCARGGPSP